METKRGERKGKDVVYRREDKRKRVESEVTEQIQNLVFVSPQEKNDDKKFEDGPSTRTRSGNLSSVSNSTPAASDAGRQARGEKNVSSTSSTVTTFGRKDYTKVKPKRGGMSAAAKKKKANKDKNLDKDDQKGLKAQQRIEKERAMASEKSIQKRKAKAVVKQSVVSDVCEQLVPLAIQGWSAVKKMTKKEEKASRGVVQDFSATSTPSTISLAAPTSGLNRDWKQLKMNQPVYTGRKGTNRGFDEGYDFLPPEPPVTKNSKVTHGRYAASSRRGRSANYADRGRFTTSAGRGRSTFGVRGHYTTSAGRGQRTHNN